MHKNVVLIKDSKIFDRIFLIKLFNFSFSVIAYLYDYISKLSIFNLRHVF